MPSHRTKSAIPEAPLCKGPDYLWPPRRWLCSPPPGSRREAARGSQRCCCAWRPRCCSQGHCLSSAPADSLDQCEWCIPGKKSNKDPVKDVGKKICARLTFSLGDLWSSSPLPQLMPELKLTCGMGGRRADFQWRGQCPHITGPLKHRFVWLVMGRYEALTRWWTCSLDKASREVMVLFL